MKISSDYKDLLSIFNAAGVRYLIVGGYAVMIYTEPHYTKDLDIWIDRSDTNAQAVFKALAQFGAPLNLRVFSRPTLPNLTCFISRRGAAPPRYHDLRLGTGV
jgi:hypothetical protein